MINLSRTPPGCGNPPDRITPENPNRDLMQNYCTLLATVCVCVCVCWGVGSKAEPVPVPAGREDHLSSVPAEEQSRDGGSGFTLILMHGSLSDVKLKDGVDILKSSFNSFVHNMPKIQVNWCIFNF